MKNGRYLSMGLTYDHETWIVKDVPARHFDQQPKNQLEQAHGLTLSFQIKEHPFFRFS